MGNGWSYRSKCCYEMGKRYLDSQQTKNAILYFVTGSNRMHIPCIRELGKLFKLAGNYERAVFFYKRGLSAGSISCALGLAEIYNDEKSGYLNHSEALRLFTACSTKQRAVAASNYGIADIYYRGLGNPVNMKMAKTHYKIAATYKCKKSMYMLGYIYKTSGNNKKSLIMYMEAYYNGCLAAKTEIDKIINNVL
jgi:TPR repeat protein